MLRLATALLLVGTALAAKPCQLRNFKEDYNVCVCNSTYCDEIEAVGDVSPGTAVLYYSSASGKRFHRSQVFPTRNIQEADVKTYLNSSGKYQTMTGFGGAFTDATGIVLNTLPQDLRDTVITQYYTDKGGLNYTFGRVPIASCDFSTHEYSYADVANDFSLVHFNLTNEDFAYKIPFIKTAQKANKNLKMFASPWSAPGWMKNTGVMKGGGFMKGEFGGTYWKTYAKYFVRFLEEYKKNDISFWGLTVQNEPDTAADPYFPWQTMYYNSSWERDFIRDLLGPALRQSAAGRNVGIIINDDNRNNMPEWANTILGDEKAKQYVIGIGVHWYEDNNVPASVLTDTHFLHPDYFIINTEACTGWTGDERGVSLGAWSRAVEFADDMINDFRNWVTGWVDWNLALDSKGGPNWVGNVVDTPIVVSDDGTEFYKQPLWNAMGHFSAFVPPGSIRVDLTGAANQYDVTYVAFLNPDGTKSVVILNRSTQYGHNVGVTDDNNNLFIVAMEPNSLATLIIG